LRAKPSPPNDRDLPVWRNYARPDDPMDDRNRKLFVPAGDPPSAQSLEK
jgi:hypothetical protein